MYVTQTWLLHGVLQSPTYKNALLDYKLCVCPVFSFPVQIPAFYAKSRSLYDKVSVLLSKLPGFYVKFLIWVSTHERCPVRPFWGVGGVAHSKRIAQN